MVVLCALAGAAGLGFLLACYVLWELTKAVKFATELTPQFDCFEPDSSSTHGVSVAVPAAQPGEVQMRTMASNGDWGTGANTAGGGGGEMIAAGTHQHSELGAGFKKVRSSNPAKYTVGTKAEVADPTLNGWYVHEVVHDQGNAGAGFILLHPQPPGTCVSAPTAQPQARLASSCS